ncbi:MAG: SprT family zinc-dependent metalloprotease [Patescibacteria group bacterium]
MNKYRIKIKDKEVDFFLRSSCRSKNLRLTIYNNGKLVITKPNKLSELRMISFLKSKSDWILDKIKSFNNLNILSEDQERSRYLEYKEKARILIGERLEHFNNYYKFEYNRVSIKNQSTCWGSCSKKSNLNFNYKIYFLPREIADYVIVHELCHLKEMNHSKSFWDLVAKTKSDYKELRKRLKGLKI